MALVKNIAVDVSSDQFAARLRMAGLRFVYERLGRALSRLDRESWPYETWLIRELMEDIWDRTVVNHYLRSDLTYVAFKQYVRDHYPDFEQDFSRCFTSAGVLSHHFDISVAIEYNRMDVIVISVDHPTPTP